ncbi:MAG: hypothetical protein P8M28_03790 [Alphaproteobacteria bacterium]|nr:hypothetical protein [Alphaproteobacteria bacterium]
MDGGTGVNTLFGSEGSDIIFGGEADGVFDSNGFDDRLYAGGSNEISDISLQDNELGGTGGVTTRYEFNDQGTASFADDTYDLQ